MFKIATIGDRQSVYGFSASGIEIFPVYTAEEGRQTLIDKSEKDYGIIFVTEAVAEKSGDIIEKYKNSVAPAIVLIPGASGNTGEGMNNVLKSIERAVGSQID